MTSNAQIKGMGWVFASSMGRPGHIRFPSSGKLPELSGKSVLKTPYKPFGRMDNYSRHGFAAIAFAMDHAGISPIAVQGMDAPKKRDIALIASSKTGCLETDLLYQATLTRAGGGLPSPALFAYTLPSCFLGEASIYFGLTGESYMMEDNEDTGLIALSTAMDCLDSGLYSEVVCGTCNSGPENGAIFLVLGSCDGPTAPAEMVITKNSGSPAICLGDKQISALTDLVPTIQTQSH